MFNNNCDLPTALETITYDACVEFMNKVGRVGFQRTDNTGNLFASETNGIELESSWTALPDADDDTKVVVSDPVEDFVFTAGDIITNAQNEDGADIVTAVGPSTINFFVRTTPANFANLKKLEIEPKLSVYLFNNKKIGAKAIDTDHVGIPISRRTFAVKDPAKDGSQGDEFRAEVQFQLAEGWYSEFAVVLAETGFNPFTDIKPA